MKDLIATNLNGKFSWREYSKPGNHDRKFGPSKVEYVCQMPVVGLVPMGVLFGGVYVAIGVSKILTSD